MLRVPMPGSDMNATLGEATIVSFPCGMSISTCMLSGNDKYTSTVDEGLPESLSEIFACSALIDFSFASPPVAVATLATIALPSGLDAAGLASSAPPAGGGIVISISFTDPNDDSGLSNSLVLPTTSTAI